jgi:predicted PurR-regulated permease PerM
LTIMVEPLPHAAPPRSEIGAALPSGLATLVALAIVVAALYVARAVLVPFALALLLSFVLAPGVLALRRLHLGRVPSVLVAVILASAVILGIGAVVASQVASLAENLPNYQRNIEAKIHAVQGAAPGGVFERAQTMLHDLGKELAQSKDEGNSAVAPARPESPKPVPVEIRTPDPAPLQVIQNVIGPLLEPLATTGIVIVFVIFILLQREDLRDRFIRLAGSRDLHRTTQAINDAAGRVSRYLLMQGVVNAIYALPIGIGLAVIGVPNAALWGLLALLLRFIPYLGTFIAAAFPLALALAVAPGWSVLIWTGALFIVVEAAVNNIVEPLLYGASTGLSSMAIILSAVFWTWLWGPVGLLLSTPLTVCLVVLGRHVPQLQFLDVMLSNRAVLAPEETFYQRILADDPDEATDQAEEFLREKSLVEFYDEVAIPALALAQYDASRGALDAGRQRRLADGIAAVIENLADHPADPADAPEAADWRDGAVLLAAGRDALDEPPTLMLAQLLEQQGIAARLVPCEAMTASRVGTVDLSGVRLVCLAYVHPESFAHARYLVRRLRRRLPDGTLMAGFWTLARDELAGRDALAATGADLVVTSLAEALEQIRAATAPGQARQAAE